MKPIVLVALVALFLITPARVWSQEQKLAQPDAESLAAADKTIKELFRRDFARTSAAERRELAIKLMNQAAETKDDPAARFVLYREAAQLTARVGDFGGAFALIDELANEFETNTAVLKIAVLKAAASAPTVPQKPLGEAALHAAHDGFASDDPAIAEEAIAIAAGAAQRLNNVDMKARAEARRAELKEVMAAFDKYKAALATLQSKPDDGPTNLVVGRYLCFVKGEWDRGLPLLAKGSDNTLKALAARDQELPDEPARQAGLADAWWEFAETVPALSKRQVLGRAAHWYREALPRLQGLAQRKAQDRLVTFQKQYPAIDGGAAIFAPFVGLWEIRYANTAVRRYTIDSRGNVFVLSDAKLQRGRLVPSGEVMQLSFERGKLEKMAIKDGEMLVQHFNPPTRLATTGIGKKKELPEREPGGAAAASGDFRDVAGIWLATQSDKSHRLYIFGPKGSGLFLTKDDASKGHLTRKDNHVIFDCNDNKICRLKSAAGGLRIDVFDPASSYPDSEPKVVSTAVRLSR